MKSDAKKDYENKDLAMLLEDIKRGGIKEVTDEYFLIALGWPLIRRYDLDDWLNVFAERHALVFTRDGKRGRSEFIRSSF